MRHAALPSWTSTQLPLRAHSMGTPVLIILRRAGSGGASSAKLMSTSAGFVVLTLVNTLSWNTPTARLPSGETRNERSGASAASCARRRTSLVGADHTPPLSVHTTARSAAVPTSRAPTDDGMSSGFADPSFSVTSCDAVPVFARHSTSSPSSESEAGPSAHGSSVGDFVDPSSGSHDQWPPTSTSSTEPFASVRSARTWVFAPSVATSVSPRPRASTRYSDDPRAKMTVPRP